jgi:hypothetical protein
MREGPHALLFLCLQTCRKHVMTHYQQHDDPLPAQSFRIYLVLGVSNQDIVHGTCSEPGHGIQLRTELQLCHIFHVPTNSLLLTKLKTLEGSHTRS